MKTLNIILLRCSFFVSVTAQKFEFKHKFDHAVPVLNVATFHMGETSNTTSTEVDEHNQQSE